MSGGALSQQQSEVVVVVVVVVVRSQYERERSDWIGDCEVMFL